MRYAIQGMTLAGLILLAGCSSFNNRPKPVGTRTTSIHWDGQANQTSMVAYLNENAQHIPALTAEDITLDCRQGKESVVLTGRMDCQKPKNFRLTAKLSFQPAADVGSNEQEFWFWVSKANPPYVYHCSHGGMARAAARMPFPFEPDMLMAALGMGDHDPNKRYEVRTNGGRIELIEQAVSTKGQPIQKVTVFNRGARGDQPTIAAHLLRDTQGKTVCEAIITHARHDPTSGAELPLRVTLHWPDQQVEMKMKLDTLHVVQQDAEAMKRLYTRRALASQQSYDLEADRLDVPSGNAELQRVSDPPPIR
jgi:hypothetical protein